MKILAAKAGPLGSMLAANIRPKNERLESSAPVTLYLDEIESGRKITAVQKTVPAWFVFGMFFVVIPIAGVLIQERNDGTFKRLHTYGVSPGVMLVGKAVTFMIMNWVQLAFMLLVGYWLVPWLGGDALHLDVNFVWFLLIVSSTSAAAISLALVIAAFSSGFDQAAALGSGINVILGAVAGVMVPRAIMPSALQHISEWSPMGWALDGMQAVFLGVPDTKMMLTRIGLLITFAVLCYVLALWRSTRALTF